MPVKKQTTIAERFPTAIDNPVDATYRRRYKQLKQIHGFSFRARKDFTSRQKTAITKAWNRHNKIVRGIERGFIEFKPLKSRATRDALGTDQHKTNRGIAVMKRGGPKVVIKGKGKKAVLEYRYISRKSKWVKWDGKQNFVEFIEQQIRENNPDFISIRLGKTNMTLEYSPKRMLRYLSDIQETVDGYEDRGKKHPFTGLFLSYAKKANRK